MTFDPYDILGVGKDADNAEIKRAYKQKSKSAHPDGGGSREAWDRVSNAYAILTDSRRREHFDRTGEAESNASDPLAGVLGVLHSVASQVLADTISRQEDVTHVDVMSRMRAQITTNIAAHEVQINEARAVIDRIKKMRPRFKFTGKGRNLFDLILLDRQQSIEKFLINAERNRDAQQGARKMLEDYSYEFSADDAQAFIKAIANMAGQAQTSPRGSFVDSLGRPFR